MQPIGMSLNPNSSLGVFEDSNPIDYKVYVEERNGVLKDHEIDGLGHNEALEVIRSMKNIKISDASKIVYHEKENKKIKAEYIKALADQTTRQVVSNIAVNVQNRADYDQLNRSNCATTTYRVVSLSVSIGILILTIVCILL